ncbi:lipid droplet-associated hydrolase-like isoform X2 [Ornithodoros turicata]|uniref:lipid droplet-associated hydrolase-like isoform X2 n=1 Tax=Ornithodoros turicata TaxID=34597 RepID=UPI0031393F81
MTEPALEETVSVAYSYQIVNRVPTKLLVVGTSRLDTDCISPLLVLIPGNLGIIDYYEEFLKEIYQACGGAVHVCGISHAGHDQVPRPLSSPDFSANPELYGLDGQIQHKLSFLDENIPVNRPILLVGHSVGAYVILQIMEKRPQMHIVHSFLLFPVFELFSKTPNAQALLGHLTLLKIGIWIVVHLLMVIPVLLKALFIKYYFCDLPSKRRTCAERATLVFLAPAVFSLVVFMAFQEVDQVQERNNEVILTFLPRLTFYYGSSDMWCPKQFYMDMKEAFPSADLHMCAHNLSHAFVLGDTSVVSTFVASKMKDLLRLP